MKYAIVESGGKQYKAVEGSTIDVDRLPLDIGKKVELKDVLLVVDGKDISIGTPTVSGTKVKTTIVDQFKAPKIIVFKYKSRQRYRVKQGHRQKYTRLLVEEIFTKGGKATKAEEAPVEEKPKAEAEAKPKTKAAPKTKTKAAPKTKTKAAPKTKTKTKAAPKTKTKTKSTPKTKTKTKAAPKAK